MHAFDSITDHIGHAVTLRVLFLHQHFFFQNDIHQLRQDVMHLDKQALEEEVQDQEQPSEDEVCCPPEDDLNFILSYVQLHS